jgi:hypothetical protein
MRVEFSSTWYDGKVQPVDSVYLRRESLGRGRLLLTYSAWVVCRVTGQRVRKRCVNSRYSKHVEGKRGKVRLVASFSTCRADTLPPMPPAAAGPPQALTPSRVKIKSETKPGTTTTLLYQREYWKRDLVPSTVRRNARQVMVRAYGGRIAKSLLLLDVSHCSAKGGEGNGVIENLKAGRKEGKSLCKK